jgi:HTH-type transcriptional regulator / antitoxin HipB
MALLEAELAAAEAAQEAGAGRRSPLGVGELILSARELTGLSQRALASKARTSQAAVTAMETGNRVPTIRTAMRLAEAAGFELVIGLRKPGAAGPVALGALFPNADDGLVDYAALRVPSVYEGPPDR